MALPTRVTATQAAAWPDWPACCLPRLLPPHGSPSLGPDFGGLLSRTKLGWLPALAGLCGAGGRVRGSPPLSPAQAAPLCFTTPGCSLGPAPPAVPPVPSPPPLPGEAPMATPNPPYPGCRWARRLSGARALWASSAALLKGSRGQSSPAHCAGAPGAGSPCPPPLLPALLPLWGHRRAASYNPHTAWKTGPFLPEPWDTW